MWVTFGFGTFWYHICQQIKQSDFPITFPISSNQPVKLAPSPTTPPAPPWPVPSKSLLDKRSWASKRRISYPFEAILDSRSVVHSRGRRVDVLEQQGLNSIKQLNNQILFIALLVCWEPLLEATKCVFSSLSGFDVWSVS